MKHSLSFRQRVCLAVLLTSLLCHPALAQPQTPVRFDASGNLVKDAAQVRAGDEITAHLARGTLAATVKKTR